MSWQLVWGTTAIAIAYTPQKFFLMSAILSLEMLERLDTGEIKYGLLCFTSSLQVWLKFIIMFDSCLLLHVIVGFC